MCCYSERNGSRHANGLKKGNIIKEEIGKFLAADLFVLEGLESKQYAGNVCHPVLLRTM